MDRALILLAFASLAGAGCDQLEWYAPPEVEGAASFVMRVVGAPVIVASELETSTRLEARGDDRYLVISAYRESLDLLGLAPGEVQAAECRPCALLAPIGVFELDTENPGRPWRRLGDLRDEAMLQVALPDRARCNACSSFEFETATLEDGSAVFTPILLPTDGRRALALDSGTGAAYWAPREGPLEVACLASPPIAATAGYSDSPSSAWTADGIGRLSHWDFARLDPQLPCSSAVTTFSSSTGEVLEAIDGPPAGVEIELFALGVSGQFYRYADDRWAAIGVPMVGANRAAVWMGPGRGMVSTDEGPVQWYTDGQTRVDRVLVDSTAVLVSQAHRFDDVGVVLAAKPYLLLFQDEFGGWRRTRDQTPTSDRIDAFTRHQGHYFMMLGGGRIRELHPEQGYCPFQHLFSESTSRYLVALEDGTMFVQEGPLRRVRPVRLSSCE